MIRESVTEPRKGLAGFWDTFMGPGTTRVDNGLILGAALGGMAAQVGYALLLPLPWSSLQILIAAVLALDLWGGVVANALPPARRWYHRPGQGPRQLLSFTAVHAFHPAVLVVFFRPGDWAFFAAVYGFLMLAAVIVVYSPPRVQQAVALLLTAVGCALLLTVFTPTPGLEWFIPVLYLKLLAGHVPADGG
jgi:hypothetical protein